MTNDPLRILVGPIFEQVDDVTPEEAGGLLGALAIRVAYPKNRPLNEVEIDVSECNVALLTEAFFQSFLAVVHRQLPEELGNARSTRWVFPDGYDDRNVELWLSPRPPNKELDS